MSQQQQEVKCPFGNYYAVAKVNQQGEIYTFLKDGVAKKDRTTGRMKHAMPTVEALMRRHTQNEFKMIVDWYWTTRNKLHNSYDKSVKDALHNDGTSPVNIPIQESEKIEPYSALKALLGKVADPTDIHALLQAAGAVRGMPEPEPEPAPVPKPTPVPTPTPAPKPEVQAAPPAVLSAITNAWATALKQAEAAGKSVPVTWNFNGRPINAYLRGIQGNSVYLTMHHMAKWKTANGELTSAVIPTTVTDIEAR